MKILKKLLIFIIIIVIFCGIYYKNTLVDKYRDLITFSGNIYHDSEDFKQNIDNKWRTVTNNVDFTDKQNTVPSSSSQTDKPITSNNSVSLVLSQKQLQNQINSYRYTVNNYKEYYNVVEKSLENFEDSVSIRVNNYSSTTYSLSVINNVLDDHYDMDYGVQGAIGTVYSDSNIYVINIKFKYKLPRNKMIVMRDETKSKAMKIISKLITPRMSDLNKELAIHNYIVNNTSYDYDNYVKGTLSEQAFTDYGVLVQGKAVCEGYSKAMFKLLNMAGLQCIVVKGTGNGEPHAWNIVKINGNYTQVDATFDDPVSTNREDVLSYNYFDISDSQMAKDHQWNLKKYPKCSTTRYNRN